MEPTREEIDRLTGPVVLEFGAEWCPHCQAIQSDMTGSLTNYPDVQHIRVEDGKGKPLGRSFRVKLWPTLVFMRDGRVVSQLVRPPSDEIAMGFAELIRGSLTSRRNATGTAVLELLKLAETAAG